MMCAYAVDVTAGILPGAYNERDARRYARACLIPDELLERPDLSLELLAWSARPWFFRCLSPVSAPAASFARPLALSMFLSVMKPPDRVGAEFPSGR
jgi:hypothetical protein